MITVADLSQQLTTSERVIRYHARKLGIAKIAGVFIFTNADAAQIKQRVEAAHPVGKKAHRVTRWRRQKKETAHG